VCIAFFALDDFCIYCGDNTSASETRLYAVSNVNAFCSYDSKQLLHKGQSRVVLALRTGQCKTYALICSCDVQLHAAVVELSAAKNADIKYSTVQNWYPGDAEGKGGIYNFVTKRALCHGANSKVSWTQVRMRCQAFYFIPACRQVCRSARTGSDSAIMCLLS